MWSDDPRLLAILAYVRWRRHFQNLRASPERKFELSCEMFGEFRMLLDAQLLTTTEFYGGWLELRDDDQTIYVPIAVGVLLEIQKDLRVLLRELTQDESLRSVAAQVDDALTFSDAALP